MRLGRFSFLVTLPAAAAAVLFAVDNLAPVELSFWPLPYSVRAPAFLSIYLAALMGALVAGFVMAVGRARYRRRARKAEARIRELEHELELAKIKPLPRADAA